MKLNQIYKCEICGNIVEIVHVGGGKLICCGKEMTLLVENTVDASKEKHVPIIEKIENGYRIKVGSVEHPMEEKHFIEFIEIYNENVLYRKYLKPGEKPSADFPELENKIVAREYCNLHGLWKSEN